MTTIIDLKYKPSQWLLLTLLLFFVVEITAQNRIWLEKMPDAWAKFQDLTPVNDQIALYQQQDKWGLVDINGNSITPAIYGKLVFDTSLPGFIRIQRRYDSDYITRGLLNFQGEIVVPPVFSSVWVLPTGNIRAVSLEYECHDFTPEGIDITPAIFKKFRSNGQEQDGLISVSEDGLVFGLTDTSGHWVVPAAYHGLYPFFSGWWSEDEWGGNGRVFHAPNFDNGNLLFSDMIPLEGGAFWANDNGQWKEYAPDGTFIAELGEFVPYFIRNRKEYRIIQYKNKFGIYDRTGKIVLEPVYAKVENGYKGDDYRITDSLDRIGIWCQGRIQIPTEFEYIRIVGDHYFAVRAKETVIYSSDFRQLATVPMQLTEQIGGNLFTDPTVFAGEYQNNTALSLPENRKVWSLESGMVPVPDNALFYRYSSGPLLCQMEDGTQALFNTDGTQILGDCIEIQVKKSYKSGHGFMLFQKSTGWGVVDLLGKIWIQPTFNALVPCGEGYFFAQTGRQWGVVNHKGNWVVPASYASYAEKPVPALFQAQQWWQFDPVSGKRDTNSYDGFKQESGNRYGLKNEKKVALGPDGTPVTDTILLSAEQIFEEPFWIKSEGNRKALFTAAGQQLTPFKYTRIVQQAKGQRDMLLSARLPEGGEVFLDQTGTEVLAVKHIVNLYRGYFVVQDKDSPTWRLIDSHLQPVGDIKSDFPEFKFFQVTARFVGHVSDTAWAVFNLKGEEVYRFTADSVFFYNNEAAYSSVLIFIAPDGGRYRLSLRDLHVRKVDYLEEYSQPFFLTVRDGGLHGVAMPGGKVILPCKYDQTIYLGGQLYLFQQKDTVVILNGRAEIVVPPAVMAIAHLPETRDEFSRYLLRTIAGKSEVWDVRTGQTWEAKQTAFISVGGQPYLVISDYSGQRNIYDKNMVPLLPKPAENIQVLSSSLLAVSSKNDEKYKIFNLKRRQMTGQEFISVTPRNNDIWRAFSNGAFLMYHDTTLLFKRQCRTVDRLNFRNSRTFLVQQEQGWQLVDIRGKALHEGYYESIKVANDYLLFIERNGKKGIMSVTGKVLVPTAYKEVRLTAIIDVFQVKRNGKWNILTDGGAKEIVLQLDQIKSANLDNCFIGENAGHYRFYTLKGTLLFEEDWEYADQFESDMAAVRKNGRWGYIDLMGKPVIPYQFDYAHRFRPSRDATVLQDGQFYTIDDRGRAGISTPGIPDYGTYFSPLELHPNKVKYIDYVNLGNGWLLFQDVTTRKYGLMDYSGKIHLAPEWDALNYEFGKKNVWLKGSKNGVVKELLYGGKMTD